jgi:hypothetical protein
MEPVGVIKVSCDVTERVNRKVSTYTGACDALRTQ